jgi:phosphoribosylformylglycinamidine synthase subunit PurQ / glutaminase
VQTDRIRICVMRVGGTNRDLDVANALDSFGVNVEVLHLNDVLRRRNLITYQGLVLPGGFAYGDYVRAGAIWGKRMLASMKEDIRRFVEARKPVLGICNGFQVLVEAGLLPGYELLSEEPQVSLASNSSGHFECRWVYLRKNKESKCIFLNELPEIVRFPVAHAEGRFVAGSEETMKKIVQGNQVALQYVQKNGTASNKSYPSNPNGSRLDIAGISDPSGIVFGLMPHPEDAFFGYQTPEWTRERNPMTSGDGFGIFKSMIDYIERTF